MWISKVNWGISIPLPPLPPLSAASYAFTSLIVRQNISFSMTIVVSELKSTLRDSSHLPASSRRRENLQNEDGVENTVGTTNY